MATIEQRFKELRNRREAEQSVAEQYEEMLLHSLHPLGRVSNTSLTHLPAYDDIADLRNIQLALVRISARLANEIQELETQSQPVRLDIGINQNK